MVQEKRYRCGIDTSTTGSVAIVEGNKIIEVLKYPEREYDKGMEKIIKAKIKLLENQPKTSTKIKTLKAELKAIKRTAYRDYKKIYDMLLKYKNDIEYVVIEEPIRQTAMQTTIDALFANAESLGVYRTICSILELPIVLVKPQIWHKQFDYNIIGKDNKEKRECIKQESIRICREKFINADDFIVLPRHKNPDDNIAESAILSLVDRSLL